MIRAKNTMVNHAKASGYTLEMKKTNLKTIT